MKHSLGVELTETAHPVQQEFAALSQESSQDKSCEHWMQIAVAQVVKRAMMCKNMFKKCTGVNETKAILQTL